MFKSFGIIRTISVAACIIAMAVSHGALAQQQQQSVVQIDGKSIGGVVTSKKGPEAGVWVVAETMDLGTRFAKMVVTDDRGRFVGPTFLKPRTTFGYVAMT